MGSLACRSITGKSPVGRLNLAVGTPQDFPAPAVRGRYVLRGGAAAPSRGGGEPARDASSLVYGNIGNFVISQKSWIPCRKPSHTVARWPPLRAKSWSTGSSLKKTSWPRRSKTVTGCGMNLMSQMLNAIDDQTTLIMTFPLGCILSKYQNASDVLLNG